MTTDTQPLAPTDADLMDLGHECDLDAIAFGRAVLARWGQPAPQQEAQEPVAVIGAGFTIFWAGHGPIAPIVERHALKVGSPLYAAPQPSPAAQGDALDAARYQWLRQEHERVDPVCHLTWKRNLQRDSSEWVNTAVLDTAIDNARKQGANHD